MSDACDAIVVGSGPNGLAAAITLARAGCSVLVYEANATIGGGARSAELTLPGFVHDVCSAVHPLAAGSPFFKTLPLERFGLEWIQPEIPLAHPLDNGSAACLCKDIDVTAEQLDDDSGAYRRLMKPLARNWENLSIEFLQPMLHWPQHPITLCALWNPGALSGNVAGEIYLQRRTSARAFRRDRRALVSSTGGAGLVSICIGAWACGTRGGLADSARRIAANFERACRLSA